MIAMVCVAAVMGCDARSVRDFFVGEPGNLLALLPKNARLDLLDYYDNDQIVFASNNLGSGTSLLKVEGDFLSLRMSDSKSLQMLLVPARDTVIAVIETFETPALDSKISFYDTDWNPVEKPEKLFKMPTLADFFHKEVSKDERAELLAKLPFEMISLNFEDGRLVARHSLKEFLGSKEFAPFEGKLQPALTYTLKGKKWQLNK